MKTSECVRPDWSVIKWGHGHGDGCSEGTVDGWEDLLGEFTGP